MFGLCHRRSESLNKNLTAEWTQLARNVPKLTDKVVFTHAEMALAASMSLVFRAVHDHTRHHDVVASRRGYQHSSLE